MATRTSALDPAPLASIRRDTEVTLPEVETVNSRLLFLQRICSKNLSQRLDQPIVARDADVDARHLIDVDGLQCAVRDGQFYG